MKRSLILLSLLFSIVKFSAAQNMLKGSIHYELNYNIPEQGQRAMQRSGFALTTGMDLATDGSNMNIRMLSAQGVKMEILYGAAGSFYLDRLNRKAYKTKEKKMDPASPGKVTVTKTAEFDTLIGHKCRKYIIEIEGHSKQLIWASPDYKISALLYDNLSGNDEQDNSYYKEIDGVPLKITSTDENGKFTFEMKATTVSDVQPPAAEFAIPADFTVLPYNQTVVGKMLMGKQ